MSINESLLDINNAPSETCCNKLLNYNQLLQKLIN